MCGKEHKAVKKKGRGRKEETKEAESALIQPNESF